MKNLLLILCEGVHDAAFVYRIIKELSQEMLPFEKQKIGALPEIIKKRFDNTKHYANQKFEDLSPHGLNPGRETQPDYIFRSENSHTYLVIHNTYGQDRNKLREEIIKGYAVQDSDPDALETYIQNYRLAVLVFFDADKSDESKLQKTASIFSKSLGIAPNTKIESGKIYVHGNIPIGCYMFQKKGVGALEDIILPIMKEGNQEIFDSVEELIEKRKHFPLFVGDTEYYENKGRIALATQLYKPSISNQRSIESFPYLNAEKLKSNNDCQVIYGLIREALSRLRDA